MKRTLITTAALILTTALNTRAAAPDPQLFEAARCNNLTQVRQLIDRGADLDAAYTSAHMPV